MGQPRKDRILAALKATMEDLSGISAEQIEAEASFLELGFDSLFLTQASMAFKKEFGVAVSFRQLMEDTPTPDAVASYIDSQLPDNAFAEPTAPTQVDAATAPGPEPVAGMDAASVASPIPSALPSSAAANTTLERVIAQQLQTMKRQLELLRQGTSGAAETTGLPVGATTPAATQPTTKPDDDAPPAKRHGAWKPVDRSAGSGLSATQQEHLDALIQRYVSRTQKSKAFTRDHRAVMADPRAVAGFRCMLKEMVYPIVTDRSAGAKLWDVDGNEYIDMTMGFGCIYFGHSPEWVTTALQDQLEQGIEIGPQTQLAGEVAHGIQRLTGMERVAFCNTGSEAVMAALRLCRTVTGRTKVAFFADDYHGIFDEVLARPASVGGNLGARPVAPGIPQQAVDNVLILDYGSEEALRTLEQHAHELAAVMVEPVQTRHPGLAPREFLKRLRAFTEKSDIPLVFDEVVTGFRMHPGGAQAWFDVKADLATYGKIIGGGLPIGIVAGSSRYMDALDGGSWDYGDASYPEVGVTYFAGTFVRHPLALRAAAAVIAHLEREGPQLQERVNAMGDRFAEQLNQLFVELRAPLNVEHCGSILYLTFLEEDRFSGLLYYYMRERGIHVWEHRALFVTPAHTEQDLEAVLQAFRESIVEMQRAGFLSNSFDAESSETKPAKTPTRAKQEVLEFPLTEPQMELWLATVLGDDASKAFHENVVVRLRGQLDDQALHRALNEVVARHEALRSTFNPEGEFQRVLPSTTLELPLEDLTSHPQPERQASMESHIRKEINRPFDTVNGPLLRGRLFRLGGEDHVLLLTLHHLVCDGWSSGVVMEELSQLYGCYANGREPELAEPMQISEYATWHRQQQEGPQAEATEKFWLDQYQGPIPVLELPTDRPRPSIQTFNGATQRYKLDPSLYVGIKKYGASQKSSLSTTLLAAYVLLLRRLTGQHDIVVGISMAGQAMVGGDNLVGHCVNMLPIRSQVDDALSFSDYLASVNQLVVNSQDHQCYTFGSLIKKLKLPRDPSRTPLVNAEFTVELVLDALEFEGLQTELREDPNRYYNKDLFFNLDASAKELSLICEYNSDLFDKTTIQRWMRHYETLLRAILERPDAPLREIPTLTGDEQQQLLADWNTTATDYPKQSSLIDVFQDQVAKTPDSIAVEGQSAAADPVSSGTPPMVALTYAELNDQVEQFARRLSARGIASGDRVGICVDRCVEMVIALLGTLRVGATYVPLDPGHPAERLRFMLDDSGARLLVSQRSVVAELSDLILNPQGGAQGGPALELLLVDDNEASGESPAPAPADAVGIPGPGPNTTAYVIYTSGSTGRPKGVAVSHRSLVNLLVTMADQPGIEAHDRLLSVTTLSFDIAGLEIYLPLIRGARLVVASADDVVDGQQLIQRLRTSSITIMQATPATWQLMIASGWSGDAQLKVCCGGEALPRDLANELCHRSASVWNLYGPTETTIWSMVHQVNVGDGTVPIGRPVANTSLFVLDEHGAPVPIGVDGELYIGGDGVAEGYVNRPELNSERFVRSPFPDLAKNTVYRTGDRVRYQPDGTLLFMGRWDDQIKLRGFRIELGEIEATLNEHPELRRAAVVLLDDDQPDPRIVAYYVTADASTVEPKALRTFCRQHLPEYMIPSHFIALDELPLTPNNKLDRSALPAPSETRSAASPAANTQQTQMEQLLTGIWQEILGVEPIDSRDNFFDLGGHSLLAVRVIVRLEEAIGVRIKPAELMFQSLGQLAADLEQRVETTDEPRRGRMGKLFDAIRNKVPFGTTREVGEGSS